MWGKIVSSIFDALDFNQATLSGCIDIICVPQDEEGTLKSTPFHVRFGKAKLLRSREKIVNLTVNGEEVDIKMKLGAEGEAYFVQETEEEIDDKEWETSPIASPTISPRSITEVSEVAPLLKLDDTEKTEDSQFLSDSEKMIDPPNSSPMVLLEEPISQDDEWSWKWGDLPKKLFRPESDIISGDDIIRVIEIKDKGNNAILDANTSSLPEDEPEIILSLCGHLLKDVHSDSIQVQDIFNANILTREDLDSNPEIWFSPNLLIRFKNKMAYYPWKIAYPLIVSLSAFYQPLSIEAIEKLLNLNIKRHGDWSGCFGEASNDSISKDRTSQEDGTDGTQNFLPISSSFPVPLSSFPLDSSVEPLNTNSNRTRFRKSLRPSSAQLNALKLKPGANSITFSVTSSLQGTKTISSTIYLWPRNPKIVISDVDGTITRSDVLGHLMPIVGRDWSHGGVAEFYTKIRQNGYYILYLTSRAIGLADSTRDYLFSLTQNEKAKLPDGPLILSPDRFFYSLKREVIDRTPYIFKIAALRDIRDLFDHQHCPFYAGFGNREADHRAYVHAGIPEAKVFIIDPKGIIRQVNTTYSKTYETLSELAEHMFPPIERNHLFEDDSDNDDKYNNFNFWKSWDYESEGIDLSPI